MSLNPATLFSLANVAVLPFWLILAIAPGSFLSKWLIRSGWVSCLLAALYLFALAHALPVLNAETFSSLANVSRAFSNDWLLLGGWVHYLAFDLMMGAMIAEEHQAQGGGRLLLLIKLFFTLMLGPVGLLIHKLFPLLLGSRQK